MKKYLDIATLPPELLLLCFSFLKSPKDLISLSKTNHCLRNAALDITLWRNKQLLPPPTVKYIKQNNYFTNYDYLVALQNGCLAISHDKTIYVLETIKFNNLFKIEMTNKINTFISLPNNRLAISLKNGTIEIWQLYHPSFNDSKNKVQKIKSQLEKSQLKCYRERIINIKHSSSTTSLTKWCRGIEALINLPNGKIASGGCCDGKIYIWDINSGECIQKFTRDNSKIIALAFLGDEKLVSVSEEKLRYQPAPLCIWDLKSNQCIKILPTNNLDNRRLAGRFHRLTALSNNLLAYSRNLSRIQIWDLKAGKFIKYLPDQSDKLAVLKSGQLITFDEETSLIKIWDITNTKVLKIINIVNNIQWIGGRGNCDITILNDGRIVCGRYNDGIYVYKFPPMPENRLVQSDKEEITDEQIVTYKFK